MWMVRWIQTHSMNKIRIFSLDYLCFPMSVYCPVSLSFIQSCHLQTIHAGNSSNSLLYCLTVLSEDASSDSEQCADMRWENYYYSFGTNELHSQLVHTNNQIQDKDESQNQGLFAHNSMRFSAPKGWIFWNYSSSPFTHGTVRTNPYIGINLPI